MFQEEKTFTVRLSLEATFPEDYEGEEDDHAWLRDWEVRMKPDLIKAVFEVLRSDPTWAVHVRNRGRPPTDEIEIAVTRDFSAKPAD